MKRNASSDYQSRNDIRVVQLAKQPAGGSDRTLKKDISDIESPLDKITALHPAVWHQGVNDTSKIVYLEKRPTGGSDITLKKNVAEVENVLDKVVALRPVTWNWKEDEDGELQYGFIAQEVEEVFPDLVSVQTWKDGTKRKFLSTNDMTPYIVGALKEQQRQIEYLKRVINED